MDDNISRILESLESRGKIPAEETWRNGLTEGLEQSMKRGDIHPSALSAVADIFPARSRDSDPGETAHILGRLILDADESLRRGSSGARLRGELRSRIERIRLDPPGEAPGRAAESRGRKEFDEKMDNRGRQGFRPTDPPGRAANREENPAAIAPEVLPQTGGDEGNGNPGDQYRPD